MTDLAQTTQTLKPPRICEWCAGIFPAKTPRWYVDPEGIELCPARADNLYVEWKCGGPADVN